MTIDPHFTESLALSHGAEDFFAPYELLWGLAAHFPDEDQESRLQHAEAALRRLVERNHIVLHECEGSSPYEAPLRRERALALLAERSAWLPPEQHGSSTSLWAAATPLGERALHGGRYRSL